MTYPLALEAILLAAGRSRRMGAQDKLLLPIDGEPMIRRSARLYLELGLPLLVITGSDNGPLRDALQGLDLTLVINPDTDDGQHSSIRAGLTAAALAAPGVILALADQPLLTPGDIALLGEDFFRAGAQRICLPQYAGTRGNPVILPADVAQHCREEHILPRAFIDAHPERVAWFAAPNDHFTRDIDTPEDAARVLGGRFLAPSSSEEGVGGGGKDATASQAAPPPLDPLL